MIQDPVKRARVKSFLIIAILVTIPCYLLGLMVLWINTGIKVRVTPTLATIEQTKLTATVNLSPTLPEPTVRFPTATSTFTPTKTREVSPSATYFIPSSTPSNTPIPSVTPPPPTNTPEPTLTPTHTNEAPTLSP